MKRQIDRRTTPKQTAVALAVALAALFVGFVPYCFGLFGGSAANAESWIVTIAACLVLVGVAFFTLRKMRKEVRAAYDGFNHTMNGVVGGLHGEAMRLGRRLSSYATYRKMHQVYERQQRRDEPTERTCQLGYQDALLRTRMQDILKIAPTCRVDVVRFHQMVQAGWEKNQELLAHEAFFCACEPGPVAGTLNGGTPAQQDIQVPYSFVPNIALAPVDESQEVAAW